METENVKSKDILGNDILLKDVPVRTTKTGEKFFDVHDLIQAELIANATRIAELEEVLNQIYIELDNERQELRRRVGIIILKALKKREGN